MLEVERWSLNCALTTEDTVSLFACSTSRLFQLAGAAWRIAGYFVTEHWTGKRWIALIDVYFVGTDGAQDRETLRAPQTYEHARRLAISRIISDLLSPACSSFIRQHLHWRHSRLRVSNWNKTSTSPHRKSPKGRCSRLSTACRRLCMAGMDKTTIIPIRCFKIGAPFSSPTTHRKRECMFHWWRLLRRNDEKKPSNLTNPQDSSSENAKICTHEFRLLFLAVSLKRVVAVIALSFRWIFR